MKLEIFTTIKKTISSKSTRLSLFSALLLLLSLGQAQAQCPLGCNNNVQISLDGDCSVEVTPDMVLEGQGGDDCDYQVVILGSNGQPITGSPFITGDYIGQTLTAEVRLGSNSCWGTLTIEDKLPPVIECLPDITIDCYEDSDLPLPIARDNCDNNVLVREVADDIVDLDCTNGFSARRTFVYQAEDDSGNKSAFCTRTVYFERIGLDDVVFPDNRDDVELPSLECDNDPVWDTNGNGYPDVEETGTPTTTDGFNIFPNLSYCELNVTFSDQRLDICESSFKVLRQWTVLDWCTGDIQEEYQIIKVLDNQKPIITCTPDIIEDGGGIDADPYTCTADWDVIPPIVIFDCSSTTYTVGYLLADTNGEAPMNGIYISDNVVTNSDSTLTIEDLPLGRTWIRYTVTDACGNVERCFTEVDVVDNVPPVPVCDEFTVATLTTNGTARIFSESFDDGSHDNCSAVTFEVQRMTPGCSQNTNIWREYVEFCCDDVAKEIMVALRVTDAAGNSNTCMVMVNVQDKLDPVIECPDNQIVDCGTDIFDLDLMGRATGTDNCGDPVITHQDFGSLNDCGTGTITRRWTATDAGGRTDVCSQSITVRDFTPFNANNNAINWPNNRDLMGCMMADTDPSSTGVPTYSGDECSQIAHTYEDQVFTFVDDACFKILRRWTVIDWCQFDQNNPIGGIWTHTQVIKINNDIAPVISNCADRTVDAFGANCDEFVEIILEATDECTPVEELVFSYELDLDNDGDIDRFGTSNDASRTLEVGQHKISWKVEDQCGNQTTCMQTITVRDRKKPTPYCLSEITTVIMPSTLMIDIWANDFDLGSFDNCPGDLRFSFSSNVNDTQRVFDCDQVGLQILEIWVTDASGNQDFCTTQINIQANEGCNGSRISGEVHAENNNTVQDVMVTLENMVSHETVQYNTPTDGGFSFFNVSSGAYEVSAERDGDYRNGVNTLDIVKIQRHILGLEDLDSPYKMIAADVNGDEKIKPSDLLTIRKLVLGVAENFGANNKSWRFIDEAYTFADAQDPFPYDDAEVIKVDNQGVNMDNNFMAVKIGDVDMTAATNFTSNEDEIEFRGANKVTLAANNTEFTTGDLVSIPVTASQATELVGMQFTLEASDLTFESVEAASMDMSDSNVALHNNNLSVSWNDVTAQSYNKGEVLFVLNFRAKTNSTLDNTLSLTSTNTKAEAYTPSLESVDVEIEVRDAKASKGAAFELMQNSPNPFADLTTISFNLPHSGKATLRVFDITGKVLTQFNAVYNKGLNEIKLDAANLQASGVMYYQLEFDGQLATKKMISIAK